MSTPINNANMPINNEPIKNKGGRPLKDINPEQVYDLAKIHCTKKEMAAVLKCNPDTLYVRFSDIIEKGYEEGKQCLRRKMFEVAYNGNVSMLIWLSKQHLGYREPEPETSTQNLAALNKFFEFVKSDKLDKKEQEQKEDKKQP